MFTSGNLFKTKYGSFIRGVGERHKKCNNRFFFRFHTAGIRKCSRAPLKSFPVLHASSNHLFMNALGES